MIEFGKTLREAREAKGYSVSQLSEITHILPQIIENLEKEDFTRIVAPIYGRGFVKLYCETVGLDAQPLVAEFMDIYSGNRQPNIRLKEVEAEEKESPAWAPEPPSAPAEPAPVEMPERQPEPISQPSEPPAFDFSAPQDEPKPFMPGPDDLPLHEDPEDNPKHGYRLPGYSMPDVPRSFWRFGVLAVAAVAVVALLVLGTRALYRATMQVPGEEVQSAECQVPSAGKDVATPKPQAPSPRHQAPSTKQPRKGVAVPPLYID